MQQPELKDRITISMYGTEKDIGAFIHVAVNELKSIQIIKSRFSEIAPAFERQPPEIVLSVNIIPDWENNSSYENEAYQQKKVRG